MIQNRAKKRPAKEEEDPRFTKAVGIVRKLLHSWREIKPHSNP